MPDVVQTAPAVTAKSFTLAEWCVFRRIGRTRAFNEVSSGRLKTYKVGTRRFVSETADAQWLRDREAEAGVSA